MEEEKKEKLIEIPEAEMLEIVETTLKEIARCLALQNMTVKTAFFTSDAIKVVGSGLAA